MQNIQELDSIALLKKHPSKNLAKGQVGTIVEKLDENTFEVEFTNSKGETLLTVPLSKKDFILLRFEAA